MEVHVRTHRLPLTEVAEKVNRAYLTVYRWVKAGKLKAYWVGGRWEVDELDLEAFRNRSNTGKGQ